MNDLQSILGSENAQSYNDYKYSIIQLDIPQTYEVFNIGIILQDKNSFKIKTIPSAFKLANCLHLQNISGIDFSLKILSDRILNYKKIEPGNVSQILKVSQIMHYTSQKDIEAAAEELFADLVTLMKGMGSKNKTINEYDKPHILTSLKEVVASKKFTNIEFNKKVSFAHKKIDTVTYAQNKPIVAAEIVSPYVSDFLRNFGESLVVMQELNANEDIRLKMIYMPLHEELKGTLKRNFDTTLEIADKNDIQVVTSPDYSAFLTQIEDFTKPYSGQLL